jgi:hypothetical protein
MSCGPVAESTPLKLNARGPSAYIDDTLAVCSRRDVASEPSVLVSGGPEYHFGFTLGVTRSPSLVSRTRNNNLRSSCPWFLDLMTACMQCLRCDVGAVLYSTLNRAKARAAELRLAIIYMRGMIKYSYSLFILSFSQISYYG